MINSKKEVALIKKSNNQYTLLRETQYINESPMQCLHRGAKEEMGLLIKVDRFLGTLLAEFYLEDGSLINKSTDYFIAKTLDKVEKDVQSYESEDTLHWFNIEKAINILKSQGEYDKGTDEAVILERIL